MVVDHLPNPVEAAKYRIPHVWGGDLSSELGQSLQKSDPKGPLYGMITKIFLDPRRGYQPTLIGRVFSGTFRLSDSIYLVNNRTSNRVKRLGVMVYVCYYAKQPFFFVRTGSYQMRNLVGVLYFNHCKFTLKYFNFYLIHFQ
ncbi:Elongation factor G [subsurface metagenome]